MFRLSVHVAEDDDGRPLQISHFPSMSPEESSKVGQAIKSNHLSMERLLIQTIEVRGLAKLKVACLIHVHVDNMNRTTCICSLFYDSCRKRALILTKNKNENLTYFYIQAYICILQDLAKDLQRFTEGACK